MKKRVFLSSPTMHGEEMQYIKQAFDTNWIAPLGRNVDTFEQQTAGYVGVRGALALSSGTAALHLAVKLAGVGRGDTVLCSDFTFAATVNPVSYEKGVQVFIDSEYDTWNMDPTALEKALKKYDGVRLAKPKAVLLAHLYGTPARLDEIAALCDAHGVPLIEDAAESFSATYRGRQTGAFGRHAALSFNGNKIITTSGGGMLLSDDEAAIEKAKFWATQSRDPAPHYQHSELGYNYRMSNVTAGIGRGQMHHLDAHHEAKRAIYMRYREGFAGLPLAMNPYLPYTEPNFWLSCLLLDRECSVPPCEIMEALARENIEARPIWKPMHMQPFYKAHDFITADGVDVPVGEDVFARGLCLPSDIKMTVAEQDCVMAVVQECLQKR